MLFNVLFILLVAASLAAIELANIYALASAGLIAALCLLALGAPLPATAQLIMTAAAVYLINKKITPKGIKRGWALGGWLASTVVLLFIIATLVSAIKLPIFMPFILLMAGVYAVALKPDLARIVMGIMVMEISGELLLAAAGERSGLTALVGLVAVILLISLVARLDDLDVAKLKELQG
mgnify:CR=1 FL=1